MNYFVVFKLSTLQFLNEIFLFCFSQLKSAVERSSNLNDTMPSDPEIRLELQIADEMADVAFARHVGG